MRAPSHFQIGGITIELGETRDLQIKISETYSGSSVHLPLRIVRGPKIGPAVFVTGAIHGDELNGTGIVRELILSPPPLLNGTLVLVPVVNVLGFERHSRYMPDRRDLNRCFPGSPNGSLTARMAYAIFNEIVQHCDFGIDLHSASTQRTNLPNIRADLSHPEVKRIAQAFGCELIVNHPGPEASLRRCATDAGCATILLEAGEVWKIEPTVVEVGACGVRNVLIELEMLDEDPTNPDYQVATDRIVWVRATEGGLLQFHVTPGDVVELGQPLATTNGLLGEIRRIQQATVPGIVMGMTTLPAVKPGDPICQIAVVNEGLPQIRAAHQLAAHQSLHQRVRQGLAAGIAVSRSDRCV